MRRIQFRTATASFLLVLAAAISVRGTEFVKVIPDDALGFIAVRNVAETDEKVGQLFTKLKIEFGGPLALLQLMTGISEGLDKSGDALLLVLPTGGEADGVEVSLWLPVADYDRFLASLGGTPGGVVTAVTVVGEDLLVTKHEGWAVLFDPDERERIPQLLQQGATPPQQVSQWESWIEATDVAVVVLPGGMRAGIQWAGAQNDDEAEVAPADQGAADDLFGPAEAPDETEIQSDDNQSSGNFVSHARNSIRNVLSSSPKLFQLVTATSAIGLGLRIDEQGNARAGLRVALREGSFEGDASDATDSHDQLPSLYESGEFVLSGAGQIPPNLSTMIAQLYAHRIVRDLKTEEKLALDNDTLSRFQEAVDQAANQVRSFAVLTKPGERNEGVYTNNFLAVRVPAADVFLDQVSEVMRLWNEMNREAERGTRLVFDVDETKVADHESTLYSIDIAAADGAPELPEIRQAMEKLFGPGGKFQLLVVPVDDSTVLLSVGTPQQTAGMVETIKQQRPVEWSVGATSQTNQLLPGQSEWRLFFSPHGYTAWRTREMDAITGPVLGGPIVKPFPPSSPIGAVGGVNADGELWADFVVPAQTIESTPDYRKRPGPQLQR